MSEVLGLALFRAIAAHAGILTAQISPTMNC